MQFPTLIELTYIPSYIPVSVIRQFAQCHCCGWPMIGIYSSNVRFECWHCEEGE